MIFITIWFCSFILTWGLSFAYFQRKFVMIADSQYNEDLFFCIGLALFAGPLAFIAYLLFLAFSKDEKKFYGFKFF